ncbi:PepSY domain-containing protein [Oceanicoccus sagamiensis]|uniref:Uncharacterized protein n=1 Tax=Oceanicoccus sagamiensis TaxID=716816 RepID=A0A1X9N452_9GAMM|nr:PepSY domain-containing protein [Oceanicoccus sagamiensis]ARN72948.1 hypothetical protein BST96_01800 [Oceanicoccus sagamiensis]
MKIHALLAAFIFPVACLFLVTGALYTWGIKGNYETDNYAIDLSQPIEPELETLLELANTELGKRNLSLPSGKPKIKSAGNHFYLDWSGAKKDIILEPTDNPLVAQLTVKQASWYRNLVQLHKAKGGVLFKIYAATFAIALALLLISGFIMAWQTPKLQRLTLITSLLGLGSFVAMVLLS